MVLCAFAFSVAVFSRTAVAAAALEGSGHSVVAGQEGAIEDGGSLASGGVKLFLWDVCVEGCGALPGWSMGCWAAPWPASRLWTWRRSGFAADIAHREFVGLSEMCGNPPLLSLSP
jgi:hypothetical protein